uniref:Uncharacterized protein n=1 Tax=Ditylum brightwellii TaxID=49249 RepID=A0A7S4WHM1_9STRA|mmetsp:Transcript_51084/g.76552  ORF Transcript_51084/g.76552 Transcript_51084/m.76552 type:complete len:118 (+) Transcript_51084:104-457(+)
MEGVQQPQQPQQQQPPQPPQPPPPMQQPQQQPQQPPPMQQQSMQHAMQQQAMQQQGYVGFGMDPNWGAGGILHQQMHGQHGDLLGCTMLAKFEVPCVLVNVLTHSKISTGEEFCVFC